MTVLFLRFVPARFSCVSMATLVTTHGNYSVCNFVIVMSLTSFTSIKSRLRFGFVKDFAKETSSLKKLKLKIWLRKSKSNFWIKWSNNGMLWWPGRNQRQWQRTLTLQRMKIETLWAIFTHCNTKARAVLTILRVKSKSAEFQRR